LDQEKSGNPAIEAGVSAVVFQPQSMIYFIASEALFEKDQKLSFMEIVFLWHSRGLRVADRLKKLVLALLPQCKLRIGSTLIRARRAGFLLN
jgi:hypothetical protein